MAAAAQPRDGEAAEVRGPRRPRLRLVKPRRIPGQLPLLRLCANCGAPLSRYNVDEDDLCQICRRRWQETPDYDPSTDTGFIEEVAELLMRNFGQRVAVGATLGVDVWVVGAAVKELRRRGFVIAAQKGVPGYTLLGWRRPEAS